MQGGFDQLLARFGVVGVEEDIEVIAERNSDRQDAAAMCAVLNVERSETDEPPAPKSRDGEQLARPKTSPPRNEPRRRLERRRRGRAPP